VLWGLSLRLIGDSKKRYAVGPKDGKIRGCPVKKAANPLTAMAIAAATKVYRTPPALSPMRSAIL
jgi:hypothetical protein